MRTLLAAVIAVQEHIVGQANVTTAALENTGVHISGACRPIDDHAVARHVDLTAHINHTGRSEGELAPCVADLTVGCRGVRIDSGPRAGQTVCERDCLSSAGG